MANRSKDASRSGSAAGSREAGNRGENQWWMYGAFGLLIVCQIAVIVLLAFKFSGNDEEGGSGISGRGISRKQPGINFVFNDVIKFKSIFPIDASIRSTTSYDLTIQVQSGKKRARFSFKLHPEGQEESSDEPPGPSDEPTETIPPWSTPSPISVGDTPGKSSTGIAAYAAGVGSKGSKRSSSQLRHYQSQTEGGSVFKPSPNSVFPAPWTVLHTRLGAYETGMWEYTFTLSHGPHNFTTGRVKLKEGEKQDLALLLDGVAVATIKQIMIGMRIAPNPGPTPEPSPDEPTTPETGEENESSEHDMSDPMHTTLDMTDPTAIGRTNGSCICPIPEPTKPPV